MRMDAVKASVAILMFGAFRFVGSVLAKQAINVIEDPQGGVNEAYLSFDPNGTVRHNPLTGTYTVKLGDSFPFSNPLSGDGTDSDSRDSGVCFVTRVNAPVLPGATVPTGVTTENVYDCTWTNHLAGGSIMVSGPFRDFSETKLAITGGTGKYSKARGSLKVRPVDVNADFVNFTYHYDFSPK
ncbi:MAG TPA: hypothetical protein VLI07_17550 [Candidatus Binatus sp.]|nr:hypothetical protein [Candidatus Binatus sp.]